MHVMMTTDMPTTANNDADLVAASLSGDRDAFGQIVARYQSLVCSLAYSATGNLTHSEDLAQETFVAAWKSLGGLREPAKLRSWLCSIARNLIHNWLRKQGREPSHRAETLEEVSEAPAPAPLPAEQTISNEEQAILWRSLERIPDNYREPLVLFYREHQSIEAVAQNLELSEDVVRQRLFRGRKLLADEVAAFVEGALARTNPSRTFTLGVIAALPLAATTAKAATIGAAIAKGGTAAKGVVTVGTIGGFLAMLGGAYISTKAQVDDSKSPRERQFMLQHFGKHIVLSVIVMVAMFGLFKASLFQAPLPQAWFLAAAGFGLSLSMAYNSARYTRRRRQIQMEDGTFDPAEWTKPRKTTEAGEGQNQTRAKTFKFMAFSMGMFLFVVLSESWRTNTKHAILITVGLALCMVRGFMHWRNHPRFINLHRFSAGFPILLAAMTLGFFNWHQYLAHLTNTTVQMIPLRDIIAFDVVTALAYATLVGWLLWKRRRSTSQPA